MRALVTPRLHERLRAGPVLVLGRHTGARPEVLTRNQVKKKMQTQRVF